MKVDDFREQEKDWASQLRGLSLVSEAGIGLAESLDAFRFVFHSYQRQSYYREDRVRLLRRYPASLLSGLTAIASSRYDEGTFWPKVGEEVGAEITQVHHADLSDGFRYGLECFRLSRFDTPLRNVGEILMHAGIPVSSVSDFLHLLSVRDSERPDLTGEDFCGWVGGIPREIAATKGLDAPTWRFLKEGGEFAIDLTDRFLSFLDAAATNRDDLVDESLQAIPPLLADEAHSFYRTGGVQNAAHSIRSRRQDFAPSVIYKDGSIQLRLPALSAAAGLESVWSFSASGESWTRQVRATWPGQAPAPLLELLNHPVTEVVVSHQLSNREWKLSVVDPQTPLLLFDCGSGKLIPPTNQLPPTQVWLAFPLGENRTHEETLEVDGNLATLELPDTPYGWRGWAFSKVDLSAVKRLRLKGEQTRWRFVSMTKRPVLSEQSPVAFVSIPGGLPVYSKRPMLSLPPVSLGLGEQTKLEWRIQVLDADGNLVASRLVESSFECREVDPWEDVAFGVAGSFEVRVIRALGQSARFAVAVMEGLEVEATPRFRWLNRQGVLGPALVSLALGGSKQELRIASGDASAETTIDTIQGSVSLLVDVPHMSISLEVEGRRSAPTTTQPLVDIERMTGVILRLQTLPEQSGAFLFIAENAIISRELEVGTASGIVRLPLARLFDAAHKSGGGDLYYESGDHVALVGRIRPRKLVSAVAVESGVLVLERMYANLDLQVCLQIDNAPWQDIAPLRLEPGVNQVPLPESVRGRGPLTISVQPYDPWDVGLESVSSKTNRQNEFRIESEIDQSLDSMEDRFIHWMAGLQPIPDERGAIEFAVDAYDAIRRCWPRERANALASDVAELTRKVGPRFLTVVASSQWLQLRHTRLLVEGWPATASVCSNPSKPAIWRRSPYLGLIESLGFLESEAVQQELSDQLGDEAASILRDGIDPAMKIGVFGPNVEVLADKPKAFQDQFWKDHIAVPGKPLSEDQRSIHARILFDSRADSRLHELIKSAPTIVEDMNDLLKSCFGQESLTPLDARKAPRTWRILPQVSLALAFSARMTARGNDEAGELFRCAQRWYADLADCAPAIVEQDLILAELWVTHWERR